MGCGLSVPHRLSGMDARGDTSIAGCPAQAPTVSDCRPITCLFGPRFPHSAWCGVECKCWQRSDPPLRLRGAQVGPRGPSAAGVRLGLADRPCAARISEQGPAWRL